MIRWPERGRRSRWLLLVYGIIAFLWLSLEDVTLGPVIMIGASGAILIVILTSFDKLGGRSIALWRLPLLTLLLGSLSGLGASLWITALMFFKNARHGHLYPDYPLERMLAMLARGPAWALAGALIGLSLGLAWLALRKDEHMEQG